MSNPEDAEKQDYSPVEQPTRGELLILSMVSTAVYLLVAFLIFHYIHDRSLLTVFEHGYAPTSQVLIGILSGGTAAAIIGWVIQRPPVSKVLNDFFIVEKVSQMRLGRFDRLQLSAFAGAGEELLFRGAIQPLLGIWLTSIIFIGIHGYFKFNSRGHILFGLLMFALSMMLGYLFEYTGLIAAMTAHAVYDVIMLKFIQRKTT